MKYRKKPVVIEAFKVEFTPPGTAFLGQWLLVGAPAWFWNAVNDRTAEVCKGQDHSYVTIRTLEGAMVADEGDYIIQGVKGELYPCKPDIFAMTYEVAE